MLTQNLFLYALLSMTGAAVPAVEIVEEARALEARQAVTCGVHYSFGVTGGCGKITAPTPGRKRMYNFGSGYNIAAFPDCVVTIVNSADCNNWQFAAFDQCGTQHQVAIFPDIASEYERNGCQPQNSNPISPKSNIEYSR
ncbi:hypothetical protein ACJQWK_01114 [Exserohilum turcicum]